MREYETTLIVQPEISDEGNQAILSKLDGVLEKQGSLRLLCDDLGKRKLAYEIRKFHKGHYFILSYLDGGQVVPELERSLRLDESVLRFMTVQVSDRVVDIEARQARAKEMEIEQRKRAEERAAREAEEAKARAEIERVAAEEAARAAEAANSAAAETAAEDAEKLDTESSEPEADASPEIEAAPAAQAADDVKESQ